MPLPTIYGPDTWGAIQIPVLPQANQPAPPRDPSTGEVTANDPCLWYIGSFLRAFLKDDENATAQWDVAGVAPGTPPIRTVVVGKPNDAGYSFRVDALPTLFLWRESNDLGYLGDNIGKDETVLKTMWVYPVGEPANTRVRLPFFNTLVKAMFSGIERGRTPGWIVDGETDPFALGAFPWTANTVFSAQEGDQVAPQPPNGLIYTCTVSGSTGGAQPTWPTTNGQTVADGGCTWRCDGTWSPNGSLLYTYAAFAKLWLEKSRQTVVKITDLQGKVISAHAGIESTWYLLEDLQFGITNRVAIDPATGVDIAVVPSQTSTQWRASTQMDLGVQLFPLSAANGFYYICTVAGVSGTTEPVWPTVVNATVTDGTCTWKCGGVVPATLAEVLA